MDAGSRPGHRVLKMGKETAISPDAYARWRESELGARTEALEKEAVFALAGSLAGAVALCMRAERGFRLLTHKFDHAPITHWSFVVINNLQVGNE